MLPLLIFFGRSFAVLQSLTVPVLIIYALYLLMLIFIFALIIFFINAEEFDFNERLELTEYEIDDLERFDRRCKQSMSAFFIALVFWIAFNAYIIQAHMSGQNSINLIYVLVAPVLISIVMYLIYRKEIKPIMSGTDANLI